MTSYKRTQSSALILLVEDFTPLARNTAFLLEVAGYDVITASDGAKALEVLEHTTPDLVISDIEMPTMSGYDLLRHLRTDTRWRTLPFIFCSDKYEYEDLNYGLDLGADDYVPKPFDFDEMLLAIYRTLPQTMPHRLKDTA